MHRNFDLAQAQRHNIAMDIRERVGIMPHEITPDEKAKRRRKNKLARRARKQQRGQ